MRLMRPVIMALVVLIHLSCLSPASADDCGPSCPQVDSGSTEEIIVTNLKHERVHSGWIVNARFVVTKKVTYILDPRLLVQPNGSTCVFIGQIEGDPTSAAATSNEFKALRLLSQYPLCLLSPRPPARPPPAVAA